MITHINPAIPVETPKGPGLAHFLIDYGPEHHLHWVVFLDESGECWTYQNPYIRARTNITQNRPVVSEIEHFQNPGEATHTRWKTDDVETAEEKAEEEKLPRKYTGILRG